MIIKPPAYRPAPPQFKVVKTLLDRVLDNTVQDAKDVVFQRVIAETQDQQVQRKGRIIWAPQAGPQTWLLSCPCPDALFGGARGGGKSDALLGDWVAHAGRHGRFARGILLRRTTPELEEVMARAHVLFPALGARWIAGTKTWVFPNGATLKMRWLERDQDATHYQGHQYTWIGIDEAGSWETPRGLDELRSTMRSAAGVPCVMRLTANPGGVGHQWLKERYVTPAQPRNIFYDSPRCTHRVYIPSRLRDNKILMLGDPSYEDRIRGSGPDWLVRAWLDGDWDACAGDAFFTEVSLLVDKRPVQWPKNTGSVFAVIDTAVKDGMQHDGTAVIYYARDPWMDKVDGAAPLIILDYDVLQIQGAMLDEWLPTVNARIEELCGYTNARWGNFGCWIEDKASGSVLIQQAQKRGIKAFPILSTLTAMGKEERAINTCGYVYQNRVKISEYAYNKVFDYKMSVCNHLISQVCGFRMGQKTGPRDLLDCFTYGIAIGLGDTEGT